MLDFDAVLHSLCFIQFNTSNSSRHAHISPYPFTFGAKTKSSVQCLWLWAQNYDTMQCFTVLAFVIMQITTSVWLFKNTCILFFKFQHVSFIAHNFYRAVCNADAVQRWELCPSVCLSVCLSVCPSEIWGQPAPVGAKSPILNR